MFKNDARPDDLPASDNEASNSGDDENMKNRKFKKPPTSFYRLMPPPPSSAKDLEKQKEKKLRDQKGLDNLAN